MLNTVLDKETSKKAKTATRKDIKIVAALNNGLSERPKNRPKKPEYKKPKKGNNRINKYINY